ncbi:MAG: KH domain-containing protein [Armatimonadota bacterium]
MQELVEYLVRQLVDDPDAVHVTPIEGERMILFEVRVAEDDMGKVIGKHGRTAHAIRTIVSAAAMKQNKKATVEILDPIDRGGAEGDDEY